MKLIQSLALSLFMLLVFAPFAHAVDIHGFAQGNYSARITGDQPVRTGASNYLLSEERFQLEIEDRTKDGLAGFFIKSDFFRDGVANTNEVEVREANVSLTKGAFDLKVGRQIITWGTGDLLFINDVFPKDYNAFYSGRPIEYLKAPVGGGKLGITTEAVSAEIVIIPAFEANRLPDPSSFYLFNPFPTATANITEKPGGKLSDTELAARLFRYFGSTDVSLYAYRGFSRMPAMMPDNLSNPATVTTFYPPINVYGFSVTGNVLDGVGNLEAGYEDSRSNRSGTNPLIENSRWKAMVGYKKELASEFTAGVQYYIEVPVNYGNYARNLPPGFPGATRYTSYATLRLTKTLWYQTLRLQFFGMYSIYDKDYLMNPEAYYKITDEVSLALGSNIFGGGKNYTNFGSLKKDANMYTYLRYQF